METELLGGAAAVDCGGGGDSQIGGESEKWHGKTVIAVHTYLHYSPLLVRGESKRARRPAIGPLHCTSAVCALAAAGCAVVVGVSCRASFVMGGAAAFYWEVYRNWPSRIAFLGGILQPKHCCTVL